VLIQIEYNQDANNSGNRDKNTSQVSHPAS
jgi:hypothetical protein